MFTGRIGAADYWKAVALLTIVGVGLAIVSNLIAYFWLFQEDHVSQWFLWTLGVGVLEFGVLPLVWATFVLGLSIRRLHDLNQPAWMVFAFVAIVPWLVIGFWPGKREPNDYGAPLKYRHPWAAIVGRWEFKTS